MASRVEEVSVLRWLKRLRSRVRRSALQREVADEMRMHIELETEELSRQGMAPAAARRQARIAFGGEDRYREEGREARGWAWLDDVLADVRHTVRSYRHSPAFTVVVLLALGLGIGANTALFSVADDILLSELPVRNPEELVVFSWSSGPRLLARQGGFQVDAATGATTSIGFSYLTFQRFREQSRTLADVFGFSGLLRPGVVDDEPDSAAVQFVSGNYFRALGVRAALGRTIVAGDEQPGAPPVAVISSRYWQRRYGQDRAVVGKALRIRDALFTIVGVTPADFPGTQQVGESPDVSLPFTSVAVFRPLPKGVPNLATPWVWNVRIMGRVRPGSTFDDVRAELQRVFVTSALEGLRAWPSAALDGRPRDMPELHVASGSRGLTDTRNRLAQAMTLLLVVVVLVLLIVWSNVTNLLLARGLGRRKEFAVRLAIGGGRSRLIRQLLTETIVLAVCGGALGVLLAYWSRDLFLVWITRTIPGFVAAPELDLRVLAFATSLSLLAGTVVGLAPAVRTTRIDLTPALNQGGQLTGGSAARVGRSLLVAQVGVSITLLVGAGLFVRTLRNLQAVDVGFDLDHLLLFEAAPSRPGNGAANSSALYDPLRASLLAVPGITGVTHSQYPLLTGALAMPYLSVRGHERQPGEDPTVDLYRVWPTFFAAMGIVLVRGRPLSEQDARSGARVVVVNETLVWRYFPDGDPIGRRIGITKDATTPDLPDSLQHEVVGVVRDARLASARRTVIPAVFEAALETYGTFEVRTSADPADIIPAIREAVRRVDGNLLLGNFRSASESMGSTYLRERHFAVLVSVFGVLAVVLVCIGLYGLLAHSVVRRTPEIGVRVALGASRREVMRLIMGESLLLLGGGIVLGLVGALAISRLIASSLFGVAPGDPLTLAAAVALPLATGLVVAFVPIRRAMRIDPVTALRG